LPLIAALVFFNIGLPASSAQTFPDSAGAAEVPPVRGAASVLVSASDRLAAEALQLIGEGNLDTALAKINAALKMRADRSYYHLINGLVYHLQATRGTDSSYELAEQGYQLAIRFDRSNWLAHYFAGQLALDMAKYDKARQLLAEAMMFRNDDRDLLNAFAFAAYRSGYPDLAAGTIDTLEKLGGLKSTIDLRNASVIMAAAGKRDRAQDYLTRMKASGDPGTTAHVQRRLNEWAGFHQQQEGFIKTQAEVAPPAAEAPVGAPGEIPVAVGPPGPPIELTAPGTENKMVVVDVVLIATEETFTTSRGMNLLNGLQLQFGSNSAPAISRIHNVAANNDMTTAITRTLTIPAITYSMNIANSNTQRNEILARPTLVATAGKLSEFFYGIELNAAVATLNTTAAPISIQKEIGVKLAVTPLFVEDGRVSLQVSAQRSFIKPSSADNTFQMKLETSKSQVSASVVMRFGESLILGGLSEKEAGNTRDGVPLLQDVPVLQYLFSKNTTTDIQKSVLIIVTPRPAQFVYQTEQARAAYEKTLSEDERPIASLRARYADWFKPYPNWASIFHHMQENSLYREFRTGDVALESWSDMRSLRDRLRLVVDFLYY